MNSRFLIDYDNPDAGIGHSMGIINRALKIAARNNLDFAYSEGQLIKSHQDSLRWKIKQILRTLRGKSEMKHIILATTSIECLASKTCLSVVKRLKAGFDVVNLK